MADSILGMTVQRMIPPELQSGLFSGQYVLDGSVIRHAAGTSKGGQIVSHLLPVSGSVPDISPVYNQLFGMASNLMAVSQLNLAMSAMSFVVITQKLNQLEKQLKAIQKDVKAIKEILVMDERSRLFAALENLSYAGRSLSEDNRRQLLFEAKQILTPVSIKYRELLQSTACAEMALSYEEYFTFTFLAHNRCLAELGMLDIAKEKMIDDTQFWQQQAKRIARENLLGEHPERFLFRDFVKDVPIRDLTDWLDFAYDDNKGVEWIDDLRARTEPWYARLDYKDVGKGATHVISSVNKMFGKRTTPQDLDKQQVIPTLGKYTAKEKVLAGYVTQYELLEKHDMTPSQLEERLRHIDNEDTIDGFLLLQADDVDSKILN